MANQLKIRFKEFRESISLSQVELAKKLKVSQGTITDIERGRIGVSKSLIKKVSEAFALPVDWYKQYEPQLLADNKQIHESITSEIKISNPWNFCPHCGKALK